MGMMICYFSELRLLTERLLISAFVNTTCLFFFEGRLYITGCVGVFEWEICLWGSRWVVLWRDLFERDIRSERLINRVLRSVYDSLVNCPCADHAAHAVLDIDGYPLARNEMSSQQPKEQPCKDICHRKQPMTAVNLFMYEV